MEPKLARLEHDLEPLSITLPSPFERGSHKKSVRHSLSCGTIAIILRSHPSMTGTYEVAMAWSRVKPLPTNPLNAPLLVSSPVIGGISGIAIFMSWSSPFSRFSSDWSFAWLLFALELVLRNCNHRRRASISLIRSSRSWKIRCNVLVAVYLRPLNEIDSSNSMASSCGDCAVLCASGWNDTLSFDPEGLNGEPSPKRSLDPLRLKPFLCCLRMLCNI